MGVRQGVNLREFCFAMLLAAAFLAVFAYGFWGIISGFWMFVTAPHLGARLLEVGSGLGLCAGVIVLMLVVLWFVPLPERASLYDDDDYA